MRWCCGLYIEARANRWGEVIRQNGQLQLNIGPPILEDLFSCVQYAPIRVLATPPTLGHAHNSGEPFVKGIEDSSRCNFDFLKCRSVADDGRDAACKLWNEVGYDVTHRVDRVGDCRPRLQFTGSALVGVEGLDIFVELSLSEAAAPLN